MKSLDGDYLQPHNDNSLTLRRLTKIGRIFLAEVMILGYGPCLQAVHWAKTSKYHPICIT